MGMVQVLHYYCKRRRAELLNDITFKKGISCQIQTDFLDISDIVKELTNKNHIDCVAIDEDLFGIGDIEDIISKLEVLKFVTDETKILIIALDRMRNDEMIQGIQKSGVVDYIITKEMIDDFDDVISKFFDGTITENEKILYTPSNNEDYDVDDISEESGVQSEIYSSDIEDNSTSEEDYQGEYSETEYNDNTENVAEQKTIISNSQSNIFSRMKESFQQNKVSEDVPSIVEVPEDRMITIGICGLQSHIGVTHHALAMAQALSEQYKYVCYKECNTHDIYDVLQNSSLKKTMPGYIRIMNVDIFNKNADVEEYSDKYKFCIMDFGTINECTQAEFFETDIPIIINLFILSNPFFYIIPPKELIFKSDIITDLVKVLGCGVEIKSAHNKNIESFNLDNLRWDKVIICTDADVDGFQIRTLVLTMIYRLMPTLIEKGKVYIAESPLYEITITKTKRKGEKHFAYTDGEKEEILKKFTEDGLSKERDEYDIKRSKGLGENEPDMMSLTTMHPSTRRLIRVTPENAESTSRMFDVLLGDNITDRKEYIADNGGKYMEMLDLS